MYTFPERELVYVLSINIRLSGFGGCRNTPQGMGIEIVENSKSKICLPTLYQLTYFVMNLICPLSRFQFPHPKVISVCTLCTPGDCSCILIVFYVSLTVFFAINIFYMYVHDSVSVHANMQRLPFPYPCLYLVAVYVLYDMIQLLCLST